MICLAYIVLTIHAVVYTTVVIVLKGNDVPPSFQFVATWTLFCNSFVNSFFYLFLLRCVRSKAKDMFRNVSMCSLQSEGQVQECFDMFAPKRRTGSGMFRCVRSKAKDRFRNVSICSL